MTKVEISTFLKEGDKEVVKFSAPPQLFTSEQEAVDALNAALRQYQLDCNRGYNEFRAPDNPFSAIIMHGINR